MFAACHFSTKPAGRFFAVFGLLMRRLMALYCRRRSSNGISLGSVICITAFACSGLKHFTRLTLSSSVLRAPQFEKMISRQMDKKTITNILTLPRITMPLIDTVLGDFLSAGRRDSSATGLAAGHSNKCQNGLKCDIQWHRASMRRLFFDVL